MKTKITLLFSILFITLTSFTTFNQDTLNAVGEYDGHEDYGYNFVVIDDEGVEKTITFHVVNDDVLMNYDLDSEDLIGTKFEIIYTIEVEITLDENGYEEENETLTIVALKAIK